MIEPRRIFSSIYLKKIQISIYNLVYKQNLSVIKIKDLRNLNHLKRIEPESKFELYEQRTLIENPKSVIVNIPSLNIYLFENAIINIRSSAIIKDSNIYYERINLNERYNEANILCHNQKYAVANILYDVTIDQGIFLGGNGSWNWYHFLLEILPKALFIKQINCKVLLVSEDINKYPTMKEALLTFINEEDYKIIFLDTNKNFRVKKLFFVNEVNKIEFNKINNNMHNRDNTYFRSKYLYSLKNRFLLKYTANNNELIEKKIFLWRDGHRVPSNQNEIMTLLEKKGFKKIETGKLSLKQQIHVFNSAEVIIGTTGAAWTNMIFCPKNVKAIIFSPRTFPDFNAFSCLAKIFEVNLIYLHYSTKTLKHYESDFKISITELENILNKYNV